MRLPDGTPGKIERVFELQPHIDVAFTLADFFDFQMGEPVNLESIRDNRTDRTFDGWQEEDLKKYFKKMNLPRICEALINLKQRYPARMLDIYAPANLVIDKNGVLRHIDTNAEIDLTVPDDEGFLPVFRPSVRIDECLGGIKSLINRFDLQE